MPASNSITPVPITAYASICGCGLGNDAFYQALITNRSALGDLTLLDIPFSTPVGQIRSMLPAIRPELEAYNSRNARVALAALDYAEDGVREAVLRAKSRYGAHRIGVIIGTSTSGLFETEAAYETLLQQGHMPDDFYFLTRHAYQATPRFLQQELHLQGPCFAVSTACSSGAKSIATGQRLIVNGICDAVLVGGIDTLCRLTLRGFNSLELISADLCKPMDKQRNGINIGEGGALLLLEKPGSQFNDRPHVLSVGESTDGYHMSAPHPEGLGAYLSMTGSLKLARLEPDAIGYINLHATATPINDEIEAKAVYKLFGDSVPCSGSKGITGHNLGAAGAIESVVALLALEHQFIPGTCGLNEVDNDFQCRVIKDPLPGQALTTVMSNSFGFGGNNASLIFASGS